MKTTRLQIGLIAVFISATLFGCKSSKVAVDSDEVAIKVDQCIELQEKAPEKRAWGEGTDYTLTDATAYAQASARTNFAYMLESAVEAGTSVMSQ